MILNATTYDPCCAWVLGLCVTRRSVICHSVFGVWFWTHLWFSVAQAFILSHGPPVCPYSWPPWCFGLLAQVHFILIYCSSSVIFAMLFLRLRKWWCSLKLSIRRRNRSDMFFYWMVPNLQESQYVFTIPRVKNEYARHAISHKIPNIFNTWIQI